MPIHGYPGGVITANPVAPTASVATGVWTTEQQLQAVSQGNWPGYEYPISRSLRFNFADSTYLNRTPGSAGNLRIWTLSFWVKLCQQTNDDGIIFSAGTSASARSQCYWALSTGRLYFTSFVSASAYGAFTNAQFRDPSAWYHVVLSVDTTQATAANRVIFYINGVAQSMNTSYGGGAIPQNSDTYVNAANGHCIGSNPPYSVGGYPTIYLTEQYLIDGQALTSSSFGLNDPETGVWSPKRYSGTYGTNGFYLNFSDNSGTTSTTLGKDSSGNGNNWTPNNFSVTAGAGNDSMVDSPTSYGTDTGVGGEVRGNYATLNPVWKNLYPGVYANGNLDFSSNTAKYGNAFSTIGLTSGKWYVEVLVSGTIGSALKLGVSNQTTLNYLVGTEDDITPTTGVGYAYFLTNGNKSTNATNSAYGNSVASGDIVGIILDLDNGKIWFSKNGTVQASGDPAAGTNAAFTGITASSVWFVGGTTYATQASFSFNFGQRAFAYTAPSGFKALCTQNLPTPTIGATSTTQADNYFNVVTRTFTAATAVITGLGFSPDWLWFKRRNTAASHSLYDRLRGTNARLLTNGTNAEITTTSAELTSFDSDGFTIGSDPGSISINSSNGDTGVVWCWKANGAGSSNTAGTITSTVSANTTSGFSIVTYTGTGANATVGHGIGTAPQMVICKNRSASAEWYVYHASLGTNKAIFLEQTAAASTSNLWWNNTAPTSTVFSLGDQTGNNGSGNSIVAYCFAPVAGYSAFGSYTGNGSSDGPFVYTGFRPRYVLIKLSSNAGEGWVLNDTSRSPYNVCAAQLQANSSGAEVSGDANTYIDILSNGFKIRTTAGTHNTSGYTYIYACFAENPFKYSLAR